MIANSAAGLIFFISGDLVYNLALLDDIKTKKSDAKAKARFQDAIDVPIDSHEELILNSIKYGFNIISSEKHEYLDWEFIKFLNSIVERDVVNLSEDNGRYFIAVKWGKNDISPLEEKEVKTKIDNLNKIKDPKIRAIEFLLYSLTSKLFGEGNKRMSFLVTNSVLISNNIGILSVQKKNIKKFNTALKKYSNDKNEINKNKLWEILDRSIITAEHSDYYVY
ncbi:hypothetical protein [Mesoplasma lactucae]|uniref:Uncharacterized protein n=1 Tax=Mesoplasma lactucae ATCC 49193 TaxID=81460 RepID=A0A291ISN7_9MOLU|nr:hypothetical protein [Mesoplasma lactucae]ATG97738.1 hypothetical protein CP520_03310 [Mesoplasma lactucae ATCC 49193]ATZ20485.1 hypothetical protein MLACT_v1c06640 [Mesoplasma lactucae ATCC 49193]MCL8216656.1 hypothetical protein [Mesoplasma lactucae ATCC 49193]